MSFNPYPEASVLATQTPVVMSLVRLMPEPHRTTALSVMLGKYQKNASVVIGRAAEGRMKNGFHTLPGGRVEKDEHPLDAAMREFVEETGLSDMETYDYKVFPEPLSVFVYPLGEDGHRRPLHRMYFVGQWNGEFPAFAGSNEMVNVWPRSLKDVLDHVQQQAYRHFMAIDPANTIGQLNILSSDALALHELREKGAVVAKG